VLGNSKIVDRLGRIVASIVLLTAQIAPFFVFAPSASASQRNETEITICHGTNSVTNPYTKISVSESAVDGSGGGDHFTEHKGSVATSLTVAQLIKDSNNKWGDIIPPVSPYHIGLNWTSEGRAVYENNCDVREHTSVKVVKDLIPSGDSGLFDLNVKKSGSDKVKDDATDGSFSSKVQISDKSNLKVYETPGSNISSLDGYTTYIECKNLDGKVLASGTRDGSKSRSLTVDKKRLIKVTR